MSNMSRSNNESGLEMASSADAGTMIWPRKRRSFFLRLKGGDDEFRNVVEKRDITHALSPLEAAILIFKAALHGSFLLLPYTYKHIGHVFGVIFLMILYLAVWGAIRLLVQMAHTLTKRTGTAQLSYGDVAEQSMLSRYPDRTKVAFVIRVITDVILFLSLFITAAIYIVESASFLKRAIEDPCITIWLLALLLGILLVLLAFISHLKWLVPLCAIGCVCIVLGAIFSIVVLYAHVLTKTRDDQALVGTAEDWPYYFGTVPFIVTWIYVVLPVENDARHPESVVQSYCSPWAMQLIFIFCVHALVAFLGYDIIGPNSMPNMLEVQHIGGDPFTAMSFFLIAIGVFLTINLLILIASRIIWYYLQERVASEFRITVDLLLTPAIMALCIALALALYKFKVVLTMLATLTVGLVSFILPPIFNFFMTRGTSEAIFQKCGRYFVNICLLIVGLLVICCGFPCDYKLWKDNRNLGGSLMEH